MDNGDNIIIIVIKNSAHATPGPYGPTSKNRRESTNQTPRPPGCPDSYNRLRETETETSPPAQKS